MGADLAWRMRPTTLDHVVGQAHLVGENGIIRRMADNQSLSSMILYGPPGVGKTSIASAIAGHSQHAFRIFNATTDSKKRLQEIAEEAKFSGGLVLLLDEIHRLDKPKQDFLLPLVESGTILLIGATTENPLFSVTPAIRSRVHLFELKPLTVDAITQALTTALADKERGVGLPVVVTDDTLALIASKSYGDLRTAYRYLELVVFASPIMNDCYQVTREVAEATLPKSAPGIDKDGTAHYDLLSALQKSIRGSDVDASLHYAARLLVGGDLMSLARRLIVIAYEDIGLANPEAHVHVVTAMKAAQKIGLPEARILVANAVIDLALSPKSNSAYLAMDKALSDLDTAGDIPIPDHLKSHPPKKSQTPYRYPHDYPNKWVQQDYLPERLKGVHYFSPNSTGKYERALGIQQEKITTYNEQE